MVALDGRDLTLVDLETGQVEDRFPPPAEGTSGESVLRVSDDGRFVAHLADVDAAEPANTLSVYEVATGRRVLGPLTPPFYAGDVAINADGSLLAVAGGANGDLAVYRVADDELVGVVPGLPRPDDVNLTRDTAAVDFGSDGRIYLGSMAGAIRVIDPATLQVLTTYEGPLLSSHNQVIVTDSGLLVAAGNEAAVAIDTTTGAIHWTFARERATNACSAIAVATTTNRLYCQSVVGSVQGSGGRVGQLDERDLATGLRTGVVLDPQQGTVGDLAITTDERELVTFSRNAPVIARWRLDGTGPVTSRVGEGWIGSQYDATGTHAARLPPLRRRTVRTEHSASTATYVWDPVANQMIDPLDDVVQAAWAGPPGRLAAIFADGTGGFYDLTTHSRVDGATFELLGSRSKQRVHLPRRHPALPRLPRRPDPIPRQHHRRPDRTDHRSRWFGRSQRPPTAPESSPPASTTAPGR